MQTDHVISTRRQELIKISNNNKEKKITWRILDFAVPADHRVKLKESGGKKDKY